MVKNIFDIFALHAINNPNHPAITLSNNKSISYKILLKEAEKVSSKLFSIGIRKDDPVCIVSETFGDRRLGTHVRRGAGAGILLLLPAEHHLPGSEAGESAHRRRRTHEDH